MKTQHLETLTYVLVVILLVIAAINQYQITAVSGMMTMQKTTSTGSSTGSQTDLTSFLPKGIPAVYGPELGVSFDDPVNSLNVMTAMDFDLNGPNPNGLSMMYSELTEEQKGRYLRIGSSIACEYCCGATTLIMADGKPACGCAHSAAMRALAKYLLQEHGSEFTDAQILEELVKWKTMFFPKQMLPKLAQQSGQQVNLTELPNMVGGC